MESSINSEILSCVNSVELHPHLCDEGLLDSDDDQDFIFSETTPNESKNQRLLALLDTKGPSARLRLLRCLDEETNHSGHRYVASLLRGRSIGDKEEIKISSEIRNRIKTCRRHLVQSINFDSLVAHLYSHALVTANELAFFGDPSKTPNVKIHMLLKWLKTKGPAAHYKFACCLEEESKHCTHQELFYMITSEKERTFIQRKRKAAGKLVIPVTKRVPDRLRAQASLISEEYFDSLRRIRKHHLTGEWEEADEIVQRCMKGSDRVICIAATLENCTGYITRCCRDTVLIEVGKAMQMCQELSIETDNRCFLMGRCEWVLAKLYRYTKEIDKALEHIQKAAEHHSGIESGEDAALTTYCHACILLERLNNPVRYSSTPQDAKNAEVFLQRSIVYASNEKFGLDLSHPRIRLAQLSLGSSPSKPGTKLDSDSISRARDSLKAVDFDNLAPRTKCIYYYTKADLVYNCNKVKEAKNFAQLALGIAKQNNFETEIRSAQTRLDRIITTV